MSPMITYSDRDEIPETLRNLDDYCTDIKQKNIFISFFQKDTRHSAGPGSI